jgi:hypothetical protein
MLAYEDEVRAPIIDGQRRRVKDFGDQAIAQHLVRALDEVS